MDCSLPVSSVYGVLQAGILEWVAIAFSNDDPIVEKITYIYVYIILYQYETAESLILPELFRKKLQRRKYSVEFWVEWETT